MIIFATLIAVLVACAIVVVLVLMCVGAGREDREGTLAGEAPTRAAAAARRFTGLYAHLDAPPRRRQRGRPRR